MGAPCRGRGPQGHARGRSQPRSRRIAPLRQPHLPSGRDRGRGHRRARARSRRARFGKALFFESEGHLDPRLALAGLAAKVIALGGRIHYEREVAPEDVAADAVLDCRGLAARGALPDLRGVKGEMLLLRTRDVTLSRPVRLLHPRIPLYVVPRADGIFMVGATMIEGGDRSAVTARSVLSCSAAPMRCIGLRRGADRRDRRRCPPGLSRQPAALDASWPGHPCQRLLSARFSAEPRDGAAGGGGPARSRQHPGEAS